MRDLARLSTCVRHDAFRPPPPWLCSESPEGEARQPDQFHPGPVRGADFIRRVVRPHLQFADACDLRHSLGSMFEVAIVRFLAGRRRHQSIAEISTGAPMRALNKTKYLDALAHLRCSQLLKSSTRVVWQAQTSAQIPSASQNLVVSWPTSRTRIGGDVVKDTIRLPVVVSCEVCVHVPM